MKTPCTPAQAEKLVLALRGTGPTQRCPLMEAAGRVLRGDIEADRDFPPFDRVMMDGLAVRFADLAGGRRNFRIAGQAAAGQPRTALPSERGTALEVMTGAVLPGGADCILPCEWYEERDGAVTLGASATPAPGAFIHRRGSDHCAGEVLLASGVRLGPAEAGIAAACGYSEIEVAAPFRIAVIGTGDELVPVEATPLDGQIRRTNVAALCSALRLSGHAPAESGALPDDEGVMRDGLRDAVERHDVVVLTGGVSKGRRDLVPPILAGLGASCVLHGIAQRPGKPMGVWQAPGGRVIFGLPGNPVSALVCLVRYILPALSHWSGAADAPPPRRMLRGTLTRPEGLTLFLPVMADADGSLAPSPVANSGDLAGLAGTCGFVEIDESFADGGSAPYFPWVLS
jgi:molybdopterin molybdotransferase